jgi:hypothetical protein
MIDLLRALRTRAAYGRRLLDFVPALVVTEMFYKFHSFSLECMAFLGTWLLFEALTEWTMRPAKAKDLPTAPSDRLAASNRRNTDR